MINRFINKGGKRLRYGYTTGSCATAAAKAATIMLITQKPLNSVEINTPKGWVLNLNIHDIELHEQYVSCAVIKDSGDDPDVTNGIKVFAKVCYHETFKITGGRGVGVVTKKGLSIPVGEPAINRVPRETITAEVTAILPENKHVLVEISVPKGEKIALKTFNPNLGIVGGISIIGTSGIVEPMSEEALKESLALELAVVKAEGVEAIVLVPGNYGRDFALGLGLKKSLIVKTSNYTGFVLDKAEEVGFNKILMIGHLGKYIKVAGGIFQTHSKYADARMEILAAYCAAMGGEQQLIEQILTCITTDEAVELIINANLRPVFNRLASRVAARASIRTHHNIEIEALIFSNEYGELGRSTKANLLLEGLINV